MRSPSAWGQSKKPPVEGVTKLKILSKVPLEFRVAGESFYSWNVWGLGKQGILLPRACVWGWHISHVRQWHSKNDIKYWSRSSKFLLSAAVAAVTVPSMGIFGMSRACVTPITLAGGSKGSQKSQLWSSTPSLSWRPNRSCVFFPCWRKILIYPKD